MLGALNNKTAGECWRTGLVGQNSKATAVNEADIRSCVGGIHDHIYNDAIAVLKWPNSITATWSATKKSRKPGLRLFSAQNLIADQVAAMEFGH